MRSLSDLRPRPGQRGVPKRVGRGDSSGHGKHAGKGVAGQKTRTGHSRRPGFEGGQTPLWRRIPKRGFRPPHPTTLAYVNVDELMRAYGDGAEITPETIKADGLVDHLRDGLKVLGRGEADKALTVHAHKFSASARSKIESAGGQAVVLAGESTEEPEDTEKAEAEAEPEPEPPSEGDEGDGPSEDEEPEEV